MTIKSTLTPKWLARATEFQSFVIEHGQMPVRANAPFGEWRYTQLRTPHPERHKWLNEHVPGWNVHLNNHAGEDLSPAWLDRARELQSFVVEHGHGPAVSTGSLGNWRRTQKKENRASRIAWLDEHAPGWRDQAKKSGLTEEWLERSKEFIDFVGKNGYLPGHPDGAIGNWRRAQMSSKFPERKRWLDERFPGWDQPQPNQPRQKRMGVR